MKRWIWGLLALSAVSLALVFALFYPGGSETPESSAHTGQTNPHVEIDMDGSDGWCTDIDTVGSHVLGDTYYVAICLTQSPQAPQAFNVDFLYDDTLNSCANVANVSPMVDDNPDANTGLTGFSAPEECNELPSTCTDATAPYDFCDDDSDGFINDGCPAKGTAEDEATQCANNLDDDSDTLVNDGCPVQLVDGLPEAVGLGGAWDCSGGMSSLNPTCDKNPGETGPGKGDAFITCLSATGPWTLPFGATVSAPLAVVKLTVKTIVGVDSLDLANVAVYGGAGEITPLDTYGATDNKIEAPADTPTPTRTNTPIPPTPTNTPTATNTPMPTNTPTPTNTPMPWAYIDKNISNGGGPCKVIDDQTTETVGSTHQLAVCVENMPEDVSAFDLTVSYDDLLDTCDEIACNQQTDPGCLNDNPDANDGNVSEWGGVGLGDDWDCTVDLAVDEPTCDLNDGDPAPGPGAGEAWISCHANEDSSTTLKSGALAVLTLDVAAAGHDNVEIEYLYVWGDDVPIAECDTDGQVAFSAALNGDSAFPMRCEGATDTKQSGETHKRPTRTPTPAPPTATPVEPTVPPPPPPPPPPTATPFGGVGPEITAPPTGSGPSAGGFTWVIWLAAGIAGTAAAAGGLYLRRATR